MCLRQMAARLVISICKFTFATLFCKEVRVQIDELLQFIKLPSKYFFNLRETP